MLSRNSTFLLHAPLEFCHFNGTTDDQRSALMDVLWLDLQDATLSVASLSTGLFGDKRDWVGFVEQSQFAIRMVGSRWVQEHAALEKRAVEIGHHRANVSRRVFPPKGTTADTVKELDVGRGKVIAVCFIDRIVPPGPRVERRIPLCTRDCRILRVNCSGVLELSQISGTRQLRCGSSSMTCRASNPYSVPRV